MADIYFSGQGTLYLGSRDTSGTVTTYQEVGNVPSITLGLETDVLEHKESTTGQRLTDLRLIREKTATLSMTVESLTTANLQLLLYGTTNSIAGSSVVAEVIPTVAVGDVYKTDFPLISSVVVNATAGTPTLNTHYTVDANGGMIEFISLAGLTQPLNVDYNYAANTKVQFFKDSSKERFLRFSGLNTANSDEAVVIELYRVVFDPVGNLDLLSDELAQFDVEGSVLYDSTRATDSTLGGFGRIITLT